MTLSRRLLALICAAAAVGAAALPAPRALAAGNAIINDCQANGQLTQPYTVRQLRHALSVMPASVKQYTSCFDVVQNALVSARKHNGTVPVSKSSKGGGSSFLPTPVIIVLVVLILAAVTFGALAIRRRRAGTAEGQDPDEPDGPGGGATRRPPSTPPPSGGGDTAETRAMPSPPVDAPSDEAPTRINERADDERP
jgi:hypothetical protein